MPEIKKERIRLTVTLAEKMEIERAAKAYGLSVAGFLRLCALQVANMVKK